MQVYKFVSFEGQKLINLKTYQLKNLKVAIYSIQSTLYEGEAEKLICRTPQGEITVLDNHLPLVSALEGPRVRVFGAAGGEQNIPIGGGVLEIRPESEVTILAN